MSPEYILIFLVALFASLLTFFSGFGLGTILLPVFLLFFPPVTAVALTAVVHLLNNIFKFILIGKNVNLKTALAFGIPAGIGAFFGARLLLNVSEVRILFSYSLLGNEFYITTVGLTLGLLMIFFSLFELVPRFKNLNIPNNLIPVGGFVSGFFGGLSGHQGALRSAFLIKAGLNKNAFIATGVVIALVVDIVRISSYYKSLSEYLSDYYLPVAAGGVGAFVGAFTGRKLIDKITISWVQIIVGIGIMVLGILILTGLIS